MIYIDYASANGVKTFPLHRLSLDDESKISIKIIDEGETDNWGDEDCTKNVTDVYTADIIVNSSIVDKFSDIDIITMLRFNYYRPCYHFIGKTQTREVLDNGDYKYSIRR